MLVLTQTDSDKTGKSYYGETNLYLLSTVANQNCRVELDAIGPIHEVSWSPHYAEFVVVYGSLRDCKLL